MRKDVVIIVTCIFILFFSIILSSCTTSNFEMITLSEAYNEGYINYENLNEIYNINNYFEEDSSKKWDEYSKNNQLGKRNKSEIIKTYNMKNNCIGETNIIIYYGTFGNAFVVKIRNENIEIPSVVTYEEISGLIFIYSTERISVFVKK